MILKYSYFEKSTFLTEKKFFLFYGPNLGKVESCIKILKNKLNSLDRTLKFLNIFQDDFLNHSFTEIINHNSQDDIFGNIDQIFAKYRPYLAIEEVLSTIFAGWRVAIASSHRPVCCSIAADD